MMPLQDHVHPSQGPGRVVHLLAVDGDAPRRFVGSLDEKRTRTARRVVDGLVRSGIRSNANDLCHDPGDFGGGVELSLALAGLRGEVAH